MSKLAIELHLAFVFDCNECGRENFVRAVTCDFDDNTVAEMKEEYGIEAYDLGDWQMQPTSVKCQFCKAEYSTDGGEPPCTSDE